MTDKFESIFENYLMGNRKDSRQSFDDLTGNERHNFTGWAKKRFEESNVDNDLIDFLLFLLS